MKIDVKIKMIQMPNFLILETPPVEKQDGFRHGSTIPIGELSEEQANEYAEEMKQSFLNHWKLRKR